MIGRCATATADHVEPAILDPFRYLGCEGFGSFRKSSRRERIRQPRIWISTQVVRRNARELFHKRLHFVGTQRAVQTEDQRLSVRDRNERRFNGLSAQVTTGFVDYGA